MVGCEGCLVGLRIWMELAMGLDLGGSLKDESSGLCLNHPQPAG